MFAHIHDLNMTHSQIGMCDHHTVMSEWEPINGYFVSKLCAVKTNSHSEQMLVVEDEGGISSFRFGSAVLSSSLLWKDNDCATCMCLYMVCVCVCARVRASIQMVSVLSSPAFCERFESFLRMFSRVLKMLIDALWHDVQIVFYTDIKVTNDWL